MDFFGAASHELKTPLTVLKGHLSGMLNGVVGYENHSKYLQRSLAVTEKMEVLIRELLYISRIEKNKTSIQFANIDCRTNRFYFREKTIPTHKYTR